MVRAQVQIEDATNEHCASSNNEYPAWRQLWSEFSQGLLSQNSGPSVASGERSRKATLVMRGE